MEEKETELLKKLELLNQKHVLDILLLNIDRIEEFMQYASQDPGLFKIMSVLVDGSLSAFKDLSTDEILRLKSLAKLFVEYASAIDPEDLKEEHRIKGITGLIKALEDPDVQRGLGVVIEILKLIGKNKKTDN